MFARPPHLVMFPLLGVAAVACRKTDTPANTNPVAQITTPANGTSVAFGTPIAFEGTVSDAESAPDLLAIAWTSVRDGTLWDGPTDPTGATAFNTANLTAGAHVVTLSATDPSDAVGTATIALTVTSANGAPSIAIVTPTSGETSNEGDAFVFEATVSDPEDPPEALVVDFESDVDGAFCHPIPTSTGSASCAYALSVGLHQLTFSALDTDDNLVSATTSFRVISGDTVDHDGDGITKADGDCDDTDPNVHPGATEVANGKDDDCNGKIDDGLDTSDDDGDGYSETNGDCDDANPAIHPGALEVVNGVDDDCDGHKDEGSTRYDVDGDCACPDPTECADSVNPACAAVTPGDCDDADPDIHRGASEIPGDAIDQDCNGHELCYADSDGDHYGRTATVNSPDIDCNGTGEAPNPDDCDDTRASVNPGAVEIPADGIDQTCDGVDGCFEDLDGDGDGTSVPRASADADCTDPGESATSTDCDDHLAAVHPGATEIVGNNRDDNCDGAEACDADADRDGYRSDVIVASTDLACDTSAGEAVPTAPVDCDDTHATVHAGATEIPGDQIDEDCDGGEMCFVDADKDGARTTALVASSDVTCTTSAGEAQAVALLDCNDGDPTVKPGATEIPGDDVDQNCDGNEICYVDLDDDDYGTTTTLSSDTNCNGAGEGHKSGECDDNDATVHPGAAEIAGDDVDENCDGGETCYVDLDDDDYGSTTVSSPDANCNGGGEGHKSGECNDANPAIHPGATEIPGDDVDQNCDGAEVCYLDLDDDDYGASTVNSADANCNGAGEGHKSGECNDNNAAIHPGATEIPGDDVDQNCDGGEICYVDLDNDDYGTSTVVSSDTNCNGAGEGHKGSDCDDNNATIYPTANELCDGLDNDCDTLVDQGVQGDGAACAVRDCRDLKALRASAPSGAYYIDVDGSSPGYTPTRVWCDQTTDGGGWTLIANNDKADFEPSGCYARIASGASLACGNTIAANSDFSARADGLQFKEFVFAAYTGVFNATSYQYMKWIATQTIPNNTGTWSLNNDANDLTITSWSSLPHISCTYYGTGMRSIGNLTPSRGASAFGSNTVSVMTYDVNLAAGQIGFTDYSDYSGNESVSNMHGLEDFQDGWGCGDVWVPLSNRGYSAFIMVR